MRRLFYVLCVVLSAVFLLSACLGSNDDNTTYYDDAALTALTLSSYNRYLHTTASDGSDSIYKLTVNASSVVMSIDQLNGLVYNLDSLPVDADLKHVTCSLTTHKNGVAMFESLISDSLFYYSVGDSIDFSVPRIVKVFSTDGQHYRDYTVTLNAKKSTQTGIAWTEVSLADYDSHDTTAGFKAKAEAAGLTWVGASRVELFAMTADGQLMASADDGESWTAELLDSDSGLLPQQGQTTVTWPYPQAGNADYTLLVGQSGAFADRLSVWRKIAVYGHGSNEGQWACLTVGAADSRFFLPASISVCLAYGGSAVGVLAFGSDGTVYRSLDQGITWKADATYSLPDEARGDMKVLTDEDDCLWLVCPQSGRAWKGVFLK